jgi:hypothetical protein
VNILSKYFRKALQQKSPEACNVEMWKGDERFFWRWWKGGENCARKDVKRIKKKKGRREPYQYKSLFKYFEVNDNDGNNNNNFGTVSSSVE